MFTYSVRASGVKIEINTRNFDGVETDCRTVAILDLSEARMLSLGLEQAISSADLTDRSMKARELGGAA